jgi:hypothetical protein
MVKNRQPLWKTSTQKTIKFLKSFKASCILLLIITLALISVFYNTVNNSQGYVSQVNEVYSLLNSASRSCFYGEDANKEKDKICLTEIGKVSTKIKKYKFINSDVNYKNAVLIEKLRFREIADVLPEDKKIETLAQSKDRLYTFYPSQELLNTSLAQQSDYQKIYFIRYIPEKSSEKQ